METKWHELFYSKTGVFTPRYLPIELYEKMITSQIPSYSVMAYFDDKNFYRYFLRDFNIPHRIGECCNGVCYLPQLSKEEVTFERLVEGCKNLNNCIIKPSKGSSAGIGVKLFETIGKDEREIIDILKSYHYNFVIERKIKECENLKCLNPSSCNSLRVHTYRNSQKQKVEYLSSYVRIGRKGNVIDNASSGGITCQVLENGTLSDYPCTVSPYKIVDKTDVGVKLAGYHIENFKEIVETAVRAHSCVPLFGIIGWDIAVDENNNIVIIEFNPNPDMRKEQLIFRDSCLLDKHKEVLKEIFQK